MSDIPEFSSLNYKIQLQLFPEHWTDLNREVSRHPKLGVILAQQEDRDPYVLLAEIAAFCGVVLGDTYTKADIKNLCEHLTTKLIEARIINI